MNFWLALCGGSGENVRLLTVILLTVHVLTVLFHVLTVLFPVLTVP